MTLVERIQGLSARRGATLIALERVIGLGRGTIRNWDANSPSVDKVLKVADYFKVPTDYLLGRIADPYERYTPCGVLSDSPVGEQGTLGDAMRRLLIGMMLIDIEVKSDKTIFYLKDSRFSIYTIEIKGGVIGQVSFRGEVGINSSGVIVKEAVVKYKAHQV